MKPLSEKEWRDKLTEISMRIWNVDYELTFEETLKQVEDGLLDTILQDRKAWGENIKNIIKMSDKYTFEDGTVFVRQRNQGAKTDE